MAIFVGPLLINAHFICFSGIFFFSVLLPSLNICIMLNCSIAFAAAAGGRATSIYPALSRCEQRRRR